MRRDDTINSIFVHGDWGYQINPFGNITHLDNDNSTLPVGEKKDLSVQITWQ